MNASRRHTWLRRARIAWVLLSLALHGWAVGIGYLVAGIESAGVTAVLPVISWFRWALVLPDELGSVRGAFTGGLFAWLVATALLVTVRRLVYELGRRD